MAGVLTVYSEATYTTEFAKDVGVYVIPFGTMDGTVGETKTILLYCKNTGDQPLTSRSIAETSDPETLQSYSVDDITFEASALALTDLAVGAEQIIYAKVIIPSGTTNVGNPRNITFSLDAMSV